jgi:hypothetical protein
MTLSIVLDQASKVERTSKGHRNLKEHRNLKAHRKSIDDLSEMTEGLDVPHLLERSRLPAQKLNMFACTASPCLTR